jgi:ABC-type proline/glycine betaine transport system ATPase subunit
MVMDNGTIQQLDAPGTLIANPANAYIKEFVIDNLRLKIDSLVKYVRPGPSPAVAQ